MPEYPAVRRLHHCLPQLQIVFCCLSCVCHMGKWAMDIKNHVISDFKMEVSMWYSGALCLRFYFGMDAFESTPFAFTS